MLNVIIQSQNMNTSIKNASSFLNKNGETMIVDGGIYNPDDQTAYINLKQINAKKVGYMSGLTHVPFTNSGVLAHELTHAYDHIVGIFTNSGLYSDPKYWKNPQHRSEVLEPRARRAANYYRQLKGLKKFRHLKSKGDIWVK